MRRFRTHFFVCYNINNMYIIIDSCLLSGKLFLSSNSLYIFNIFHNVFNIFCCCTLDFSTFLTAFSTAFLTICICKVYCHYIKKAAKYTNYVYLAAFRLSIKLLKRASSKEIKLTFCLPCKG